MHAATHISNHPAGWQPQCNYITDPPADVMPPCTYSASGHMKKHKVVIIIVIAIYQNSYENPVASITTGSDQRSQTAAEDRAATWRTQTS